MSGTPNDLRIEPASDTDAGAIAALITALCERFIVCDFGEEGRTNMLNSCNEAAIRNYIEQGFDYHVAKKSGELVGVVATRDDSHLYHLFVREDLQRSGLSRQLWTLAKNRCIARGNASRFTVNSSSNAVGVYERFGFVRSGSADTRGGVTSHPMVLDIARR